MVLNTADNSRRTLLALADLRFFGRPQKVIWVEWLGQEPDCKDLRRES